MAPIKETKYWPPRDRNEVGVAVSPALLANLAAASAPAILPFTHLLLPLWVALIRLLPFQLGRKSKCRRAKRRTAPERAEEGFYLRYPLLPAASSLQQGCTGAGVVQRMLDLLLSLWSAANTWVVPWGLCCSLPLSPQLGSVLAGSRRDSGARAEETCCLMCCLQDTSDGGSCEQDFGEQATAVVKEQD